MPGQMLRQPLLSIIILCVELLQPGFGILLNKGLISISAMHRNNKINRVIQPGF